ncbi:MAG: tryptophan--tRNA ligase [Acidimicrobiia bacterium]|nr:tryptophan--tRNA ligase [Acidimicrobiia bacterium]
MARSVVFSGVQPTGGVHIGNYLGAFRNWIRLQDDYDPIYCIVDLHALTETEDPQELVANRLETAKLLLAAGVDLELSMFYFQSDVPQHAELAWILGTMTPMGVLNRMTQYKEKSDKYGAQLGLFSYPVLMAADILLFRAEFVPVGDDQLQHLEMTRDLAERFNNRFGDEFPVPQPIVPEVGARIMSLQDPLAKMSKSDPNENSRIGMLDEPDQIRKKLARAVTDSETEIRFDREHKPGVSNLLEITSLLGGTSVPDLEKQFQGSGYGQLKESAAEALVDALEPIRTKYESLDDREVLTLMEEGGAAARMRAEGFQQSVRAKVGLDG